MPRDYFFIDGLSGEERCNVINESIVRLHNTGVDALSLTCNVPACHLAMIHALGCNIDPFHPILSIFKNLLVSL